MRGICASKRAVFTSKLQRHLLHHIASNVYVLYYNITVLKLSQSFSTVAVFGGIMNKKCRRVQLTIWMEQTLVNRSITHFKIKY